MGAVRRGVNLYLGILKTEPEHEGVDRRVVFDVCGDGLVGLLQVADLKPDRPLSIAQQQHLLNRAKPRNVWPGCTRAHAISAQARGLDRSGARYIAAHILRSRALALTRTAAAGALGTGLAGVRAQCGRGRR
jgi:hypothetical protein